jgi:hypothetical protein
MERKNEVIKNNEDKVWYTINHTINLGNYENIKIEAGLSQTLLEGEDPYKLINKISDKLISQIIQKGQDLK